MVSHTEIVSLQKFSKAPILHTPGIRQSLHTHDLGSWCFGENVGTEPQSLEFLLGFHYVGKIDEIVGHVIELNLLEDFQLLITCFISPVTELHRDLIWGPSPSPVRS